MKSNATSVAEYLKSLPPDRRAAIEAVREVILTNLPKGFEETMTYGMIGYVVPHRIYPAGYHCDPKHPLPFVNVGSQKNHISIHLMNVYGDPDTEQWFRSAWLATGKKLDMGKGCLRFKKLEDLSLEVLGALIARTTVEKHVARFKQLAAGRKQKK